MHTFTRLTLCIVISWIFSGSVLATPFSVDNTPGRLPKNVLPISYAISFTPNLVEHTLAGRERILLQVRASTDRIQFNSLNEKLHDVRLDGRSVTKVVSDDTAQLTTLTLAAPAAPGMHTLTFSYSGKIETQPRGLFVQPYATPGRASGVLLSTQMEATDARRLFPCWDEPAFRATFQLTATVAAAWASVSNMPVEKRVVHGALATTTFADTPKMPSYLVEYTAGDLGEISATGNGTRFGVWAVHGSQNDGEVALANAQTILADYNEYFGFKFPLPKLDSIAVPGGFSGAMENWGAITYNDQLLLISGSTSLAERQQVYSTQAHEMAHQWYGDLVTMAWWDDIWLNESFASWMAAKETARRNPSWNWWESADEDKERAMGADARVTSHAIQQHVTDELQATTSFDPQITYDKGQSILRMFEAYLGADVFRDGMRAYMKAFAFSNATTGDLWRTLSQSSGKDIAAIAAGWTAQPGFPLVDVVTACDASGTRTITLTQQRFLLQGTSSEGSHWQVPLQVRIGSDEASHALLLEKDRQTAPAGRCDEPLSVDAGAIGFYRTRYDAATLEVDTRNFGRLPDADRIALLDDQWALAEAGTAPLSDYLRLAASMGSNLDARAWSQIAAALGSIEYDERDTHGHDAFAAYARSILMPAFQRLGWTARPDETPAVQTLRTTLIGELGTLGQQEIIDGARQRFAAFVTDHAAIPPDQQAAILKIVAQNADASTFERLHAVARTAQNENELRRFYSALTAVRDPALARQVGALILSKEIPEQAQTQRLTMVIQLAAAHQQLAWQLLQDNVDVLTKPLGFEGSLMLAQYLPEVFWSGIPVQTIEAFARSHVSAEMNSNIERGLETVRFRVAEKERLVRSADELASRHSQ